MSEAAPFGCTRAMRIIAENKIAAAIEAGEFAALPGLGKPSPLIDEPYDPYWWIRGKLRQENCGLTRAMVGSGDLHGKHTAHRA
jgi:hypothetical protein